MVGAGFDDCQAGGDCGSAYVFEKPAGGWAGALTEAAKLTASDAAASDEFGRPVSVSGDTVVVGAKFDDCPAGSNCGSAYVFEKPGGGWAGALTQDAKLTASDAAAGDEFGVSVAVSGDTVVVSAYLDDCTAGGFCGSAYVFGKPAGGWAGALTQDAKLTASDAAAGDEFGVSVFISGDTVVVGAFLDDCTAGVSCGSAYVFSFPAPTLTSLSPAAIPAGRPGFTLTATGTNFVPTSVIHFGATAVATIFVSSTTLTAMVPAALIAVPGTRIVTVESPAPGGGISGGLPFVVEDLSSISGLDPSTACAGDVSFLLTVTGSDFLGGSQITWDGVAQPTNFVDGSTLTALIPGALLAAPGDRAVRVVSPGGGETRGRNFRINGPSIGLLRPSSAAARWTAV